MFAAFVLHSAYANTPLSPWKRTFLVGSGITKARQTQTIHLANTPFPGLDNLYTGSSTLYGATLVGFAMEREMSTPSENVITTPGLEIDYLYNHSVGGTVKPMVI